MSIIAENITKLYGSQLALNNVSFSAISGEIMGFIGPNGAGKSTMMKIICALLAPDSGTVKINNMAVTLDSSEIKKRLGYLPENNPLYPDMYVEEYLQFTAGMYNLGKSTDKKVKQVIGLTGLSPEKHKKIGALSKGYRQRVGLAQAIIHDPDILVLDEPTSGLDPNQIVEIRNLISGLGKEKTVILSTHILQEVEAICNRILILNKGQVVANDRTENIGNITRKGLHTIIVEFSENPSSEILNQIPGVEEIKQIKTNKWLIQITGEDDVRKDLFNLAVKNNLTIISMQRNDKKLEDVFRELTL